MDLNLMSLKVDFGTTLITGFARIKRTDYVEL